MFMNSRMAVSQIPTTYERVKHAFKKNHPIKVAKLNGLTCHFTLTISMLQALKLVVSVNTMPSFRK